ncbi:hypothetical protein KP509_27G033400 [Ceratopteris richardii]|nr:hypothetical protein KP509_27G033400 [Ceratopteris richardii]
MRSAKALAAGLGLGAAAALMAPPSADAAVQEIADLAADSDSRGLLVLLVLAPAVGWVLFNILKPALNQLDKMRSAKGLVGAVGISTALLLSTDAADAAEAAGGSDARGLLLAASLVPALGWVLFNILQPALNQLEKMKVSKGLVAAVGLGAAGALLPLRSDAAEEIAAIAAAADTDNRGILLLAVLVPAVGWVLYNILQPALNQLDKMRVQK